MLRSGTSRLLSSSPCCDFCNPSVELGPSGWPWDWSYPLETGGFISRYTLKTMTLHSQNLSVVEQWGLGSSENLLHSCLTVDSSVTLWTQCRHPQLLWVYDCNNCVLFIRWHLAFIFSPLVSLLPSNAPRVLEKDNINVLFRTE